LSTKTFRPGGPIREEHKVADIKAVTDANFAEEVLSSATPVLVDFWAEWCGPCRQVAPILGEIADQYGEQIKVVKLNVDENPQTPAQYRVTGIPTLNVYQGGEVVKTIVGAKPKSALLGDLKTFLS
jgi:thioredoxin 1